jgi:hypothetical protein
MGEKKKIYHALVDGATAGLSDKALYDFVQAECGKTGSKKIVRASLLALSDPDLRDGNILNTIYALAIKHRLDAVGPDQHESDEVEVAPSIATKDAQAPAPKRPRTKAKPAATEATPEEATPEA